MWVLRACAFAWVCRPVYPPSVGNSVVLQETCLIEAFNLKSAIEYNMDNHEAAKEALSDMPPRQEHELDAVSLHNQVSLSLNKPVGPCERNHANHTPRRDFCSTPGAHRHGR